MEKPNSDIISIVKLPQGISRVLLLSPILREYGWENT